MRVRDLGTTRCGATATAAILDDYRRRAKAERQASRPHAPRRPHAPTLGTGGD
jgi:deoxyribose-phosphate aldolase